MAERFANRTEAGRALGRALSRYGGREDVVVLALPRGGVPVGFEVAEALGAQLDVFVVRKLGVPGQEELAMGAIATGGIRVLNEDVLRTLSIPEATVATAAASEQEELERREREYRRGRAPAQLQDRVAILVDDGLATGSTMRAAVQAARAHGPSQVVVAVPVAPAETCRQLEAAADEVVCLATPEPFHAVGVWYDDFPQTSDREVTSLLERYRTGAVPPADRS